MADPNNANMAIDEGLADEEINEDVRVQLETLPLEMEAIALNDRPIPNGNHQEATLRTIDIEGSGDHVIANTEDPITADFAMSVDSAGDASPAVQPNQPRCTIKKLHLFFKWEWKANAPVCFICRNYIAAACVHCHSGARNPAECVSARGICQHVFHLHCIAQWIPNGNTCPLDGTQWRYQ